MSKEKQIEEMSKAMHDGCSIVKATNQCRGEDCLDCGAMTLYEKGYRKASEVVNEVFADVFKAIRKYYIEAEHTKSVTCELMLDDLKGDLAELKKKYTEDTK